MTLSLQSSKITTHEVVSESVMVTLNYNSEYTATLIAVNCAGESNPVILPHIKFSKFIDIFK
jgi:hypothetical protein